MSFMGTCYGNVVPELELYLESQKDIPQNASSNDEYETPFFGKGPGVRIRNFFINKSHTDVSITLLKNQEKYKAHKLVLRMTSSLFEEMLADEKDYLSLEDEPDAFRWILFHAYFGYSEIPQKISDVVNLYKTLRKYSMNTLANKMVVHLNANINVETVNEILDVAVQYKETLLEDACNCVIRLNGQELLKMAVKGSLSKKLLMTLLETNSLLIEEIKLFEALVLWGKANVSILNEKGKNTTLRDFLLPFLYEIDFLSMQTEEIIKTVSQEDIFTEEEIIGILMTRRGILGEFSRTQRDKNHHRDKLGSSCDSKVHIYYPTCLRNKPKQRRLNNPDDLLLTCPIITYMKCDYKSKWLPCGVYVLMILQVSEDIYLRQIKARGDCYLGETCLDIKDSELGGINSSMDGPPWVFNFPVNLRKKVNYVVTVKGKGRICKHELVMFATEHYDVEFCGESVLCDISIKYLK